MMDEARCIWNGVVKALGSCGRNPFDRSQIQGHTEHANYPCLKNYYLSEWAQAAMPLHKKHPVHCPCERTTGLGYNTCRW